MPDDFAIAEEAPTPAPIIMEGAQGPRVEPQPIPWWLQEQYTAQREKQNREQVQNEVMRIMQTVPVRSAEDATAAIQMAMRLEGALGYQADVSAGEDPSRAIAKWGPKMYFQHPQALAPAIQGLKPVGQPTVLDLPGMPKAFLSPTGRITVPPASAMQGVGGEMPLPTEAVEVKDPQGRVISYATRLRSGQTHFIPVPKQFTQETVKRIKGIDDQLAPLRQELAGYKKDLDDIDPSTEADTYQKKARKALNVQRDIDELMRQRDAILKSTQMQSTAVMAPQTMDSVAEMESEEAVEESEELPMPVSLPSIPVAHPKHLTEEQARAFLKQSGGDKAKARKMAKDAGFTF